MRVSEIESRRVRSILLPPLVLWLRRGDNCRARVTLVVVIISSVAAGRHSPDRLIKNFMLARRRNRGAQRAPTEGRKSVRRIVRVAMRPDEIKTVLLRAVAAILLLAGEAEQKNAKYDGEKIGSSGDAILSPARSRLL